MKTVGKCHQKMQINSEFVRSGNPLTVEVGDKTEFHWVAASQKLSVIVWTKLT